MDKPFVSAVILAGGSGSRLESTVKKQFLSLNNKPVLYYSIDTFQRSVSVDEIVIVLPADSMDYYSDKIAPLGQFPKVRQIARGGQRRQDSVFNGISIVSENTDIVLVHDAARPLVDTETIDRVAGQTMVSDCAICAVHINDTVKQTGHNGLIEKTISRDNLWLAQTPQGIKHDLLKRAFKHVQSNNLTVTDEAGLVELIGITPAVVQGSKYNIKITTSYDLKLAEFYLKEVV